MSSHFINGNIVELFPYDPQSESCGPNKHVIMIFEIERCTHFYIEIKTEKFEIKLLTVAKS